jgi:hypothetical protein
MKAVLLTVLAVALVGCYTPRQVERCRAKRQADILRLGAKDGAVFAGVDVYGLKDALQDDPTGTAAALGKDGLIAALVAGAAAFVADQANDDGGSKAKASPPAIQADLVIYNTGAGSVNYVGGDAW